MNKKISSKLPLIITIIVAVVAIVAVVVVVLVKNLNNDVINDAYFKTNDKRVVLTEEIANNNDEDSEGLYYGAIRVHQVYETEGDSIKNLTIYYEFSNAYRAEKAYNNVLEDVKNDPALVGATLNGKYVGIEMAEERYEGSTAKQVRDWYEMIERSKNETEEEFDEELEEYAEKYNNTEEPEYYDETEDDLDDGDIEPEEDGFEVTFEE